MHIDQLIGHCPEETCNDIVVYVKTLEEHNTNLLKFIKVAQENSLVLNSKNYNIQQLQISMDVCSQQMVSNWIWLKFKEQLTYKLPDIQQLQYSRHD